MPPKAASKRAAPAAERQSKRAKTSAATPAQPAENAPSLSNSKRWAKVSASRNADDDFRQAVQDVSRANGYICICKPPFIDGNGDDDEEDEESDEETDEDDDEDNTCRAARGDDKPKCDGGEKCPVGQALPQRIMLYHTPLLICMGCTLMRTPYALSTGSDHELLISKDT